MSDGTEAVPDWMREIREDYVATLPERLAEIRKHLAAAGTDNTELEPLEAALHRLHGSAGSYGFDEIGTIAGACEELLNFRRKTNSVTDATLEELRHEVARIADAVERVRTEEST